MRFVSSVIDVIYGAVEVRHLHAVLVYVAWDQGAILSDISTNSIRIESIISVVLECLEQVLLAVEVAAEHDQVVEFLHQVVTVGSDQHLQTSLHTPDQQPGHQNLVVRIEVALRFIDDQEVIGPSNVLQKEVEIRQPARRGRCQMEWDAKPPRTARGRRERDAVPGNLVVRTGQPSQCGGKFVLEQFALLTLEIRDTSCVINVVLHGQCIPAGRPIQQKKEIGLGSGALIAHLS